MVHGIALLKTKGWTPARLARELGGITSQAICQWEYVPASRCVAVSKLTGISLHRLNPDVFPARKMEPAE